MPACIFGFSHFRHLPLSSRLPPLWRIVKQGTFACLRHRCPHHVCCSSRPSCCPPPVSHPALAHLRLLILPPQARIYGENCLCVVFVVPSHEVVLSALSHFPGSHSVSWAFFHQESSVIGLPDECSMYTYIQYIYIYIYM